MLSRIRSFLRDERGQGLAEYGLIIALVALAVVGALTALGGGLTSIFGDINDDLTNATSGGSS
ncbi:MAG: Flp family type IVb pilin [Peptococcaceae bacterium]|jgi:pilus assembly protein Flp/PilA|nr:Flp family type IVb pilin [Peptococcaceae bacterium]MDH7524800.1 Flp family type IVb pilin [Peptococcaceae bacterium]